MTAIKFFNCFKVKEKKSENGPDYTISAKIGEKYVDIGAGWAKSSEDGTKFISFKLSDPYKERDGFVLVLEGAPTAKSHEEEIL